MAQNNEKIILFHYNESIYSHKVLWYLKLAGVQYSECIQSPIMPRPDLAALGISYRRIPLLAIGRHVYCDSRLILQILQEKYPLKNVSMGGSDKAIQRLLQDWTHDQIFWHATRCLPFERSALANNPVFLADRSEAIGRPFSIEEMAKERPESYSYIRSLFQQLEMFLEDGRNWILSSTGPSLADIDAVYIAQWIVTNPLMEGILPEFLYEKHFPKTWARVHRFKQAVRDAESRAPTPTTLNGREAHDKITFAPLTPINGDISETDLLNLKVGQTIEVYPTDWASSHVDHGELVMLAANEVCIRNAQGVLVHFPRWNFRIQAVKDETLPAASSVKDTLPQLERPHRLFYHPLSPYSRKVYMLALELGTADRIKLQTVVVAPVKYPGWSDDVPTVAKSNPLAKLPTLVLGNNGDGVYDSKVICDFLENEALTNKRSDSRPRSWQLRTLHACADGMLDAQVLILYEKKIRAENNLSYQAWIDGQNEKIMRGFDQLELEVGRGTLQSPAKDTPASAAECAVASCVAFSDIVGLEWRDGRSKLVDWFQRWQERESFLKTRPDVDWKTGETADIGFGRNVLAGKKG